MTNKTAKQKRELLLDVSWGDNDRWIIWDISHILSYLWFQDKQRYMENVGYSIIGTTAVVHIIDNTYQGMTYEQAKRIAIAYVSGNTSIYRLD